MREFVAKIRLSVFISAIITIALGVVLIIYPAEAALMVCKIIGVMLIVMGIFGLITTLIASNKPNGLLIGWAILLVIGIFIFINPGTLATLIPVFMGILLLFHGMMDFKLAVEAQKNKGENWAMLYLVSLLTIALAALCVLHAFNIVTLTYTVIGIMLLVDGITDLYAAIKAILASKAAKQAAKDAEAINTGATVISEDGTQETIPPASEDGNPSSADTDEDRLLDED